MRAPGAPTYRVFASLGYVGEVRRDRDSDGDGVLDERDACPAQAEDRDGFEDDDDTDGCPENDNDRDGVPDEKDRCPDAAEDFDGFGDDDGCPELDNDGDGVPDRVDQCLMQPGTAERNGCPEPPKPELARVTEEKFELTQTVQFENGSASIAAESSALLDSVADILKAHPELTHVVVEGHSDDRGQAAYNQRLSADHVKSVVDALVPRGVEASRLTSEGFGPTRPRVPNDMPENRAANRRVELRIEKRAP